MLNDRPEIKKLGPIVWLSWSVWLGGNECESMKPIQMCATGQNTAETSQIIDVE